MSEAYSSSFLPPSAANGVLAGEDTAHGLSSGSDTSPRSSSCYTRKKKVPSFSNIFSGTSPVFSFFSSLTSPEQNKKMVAEKVGKEARDTDGQTGGHGSEHPRHEPFRPETGMRRGLFFSSLASSSTSKDDRLPSSYDQSFLFPDSPRQSHAPTPFSFRPVGLADFLVMMMNIRGSGRPRLLGCPASSTDILVQRRASTTATIFTRDAGAEVAGPGAPSRYTSEGREGGVEELQRTGQDVRGGKADCELTADSSTDRGSCGGDALRQRGGCPCTHLEENEEERTDEGRDVALAGPALDDPRESPVPAEHSGTTRNHLAGFTEPTRAVEKDGHQDVPSRGQEKNMMVQENVADIPAEHTENLGIHGESSSAGESAGDEAFACLGAQPLSAASKSCTAPGRSSSSCWRSVYRSRLISFFKKLLPEIFVHWLQTLCIDGSKSPVPASVVSGEDYTPLAGLEGEGKMEKTALFVTEEAGRLLWGSACSLVLNPLVAFYCQCYILSGLGTLVFATSMCHWWKPEFGLRRTIDVLTVCVVASIHWITALCFLDYSFQLVYLLITGVGTLSYFRGCAYAARGQHMLGAWCHVALHVMGTVGNMILYLYFAYSARA